jgi:cupin fold WbuC family metalloprotein
MEDSSYSLSTKDSFTTKEDKNARSKSFYSKYELVNVTTDLILELKSIANKEQRNSRVLLHASNQDLVHEMIIFQHFRNFFPPKKHNNKMKSFKIHEGELAIFIFDENGKVIDLSKLDGKNNLMYRVGPGHYHMDIPLTPQTIHFETTTGPFLGDIDNIIPPWFSKLENDEEKMKFHDNLLKTYA